MKSLFSIIVLIFFGVIARFTVHIPLGIVSLPGRFIAFPENPGKLCKHSKGKLIFAIIISTIAESYIYLAYTAFIVNWTILAISKHGANFIMWPISFCVVILPLWSLLV